MTPIEHIPRQRLLDPAGRCKEPALFLGSDSEPSHRLGVVIVLAAILVILPRKCAPSSQYRGSPETLETHRASSHLIRSKRYEVGHP